jgi:hypothetical protein
MLHLEKPVVEQGGAGGANWGPLDTPETCSTTTLPSVGGWVVEQWSRVGFDVVVSRWSKTRVNMDSKHILDCYEIDGLDEIDDGMQIARVWCDTHGAYEWHSIPLDRVEHGGHWSTERKPLWTHP